MVKFFTEIPSSLVPWIQEQKMFWVATAPLSASGHVNLSPKGYEGTFHIIDEKTVWYEDLTGSGVETIAHLKENGRMTIMFTAFNGPPRIVRLWGIGTAHEFGSPGYEALIPVANRHVGSRSAIVLNIHKVSSSCGYAVPLFDFKNHRTGLNKHTALEMEDIKAETDSCDVSISSSPSSNKLAVNTIVPAEIDTPSQAQSYPLTAKGLKGYWRVNNYKSIDGLPGITNGFKTLQTFSPNTIKAVAGVQPKDLERVESVQVRRGVLSWKQERYGVVMGFVLGVLAMVVAQRATSVLAGILIV